MLRRSLGLVGLTIANVDRLTGWDWGFSLLRRYGLSPQTVFDIGVAEGTPELYAAFPDAHFHLFDPTRESLPHMQQVANRLEVTIHNVALGEVAGECDIAVRQEIGGSSLFKEIGEAEIRARYIVPRKRFDALVPTGFQRPALAKIDVQGAELEVLRGMGTRIDDLDAVLIETSLIATVEDGPEFRDVFQFFDDRGWVLADVLGLNRRPLDKALAQIDALFIPAGSPVRADRRWRDGPR